eukprot:GILK01008112.1.p1 GENE.GILK01008112.1~~GILK01008112.1.p1  ORF type:complete len:334 (-),score=34.61 GILK01008112.1:102-1103(-)
MLFTNNQNTTITNRKAAATGLLWTQFSMIRIFLYTKEVSSALNHIYFCHSELTMDSIDDFVEKVQSFLTASVIPGAIYLPLWSVCVGTMLNILLLFSSGLLHIFLAAASLTITLMYFTKTRSYQLIRGKAPVDGEVSRFGTPTRKHVRIQTERADEPIDTTWLSSILRFCVRMFSKASPPELSVFALEVALWSPAPSVEVLFCMFPPTHVVLSHVASSFTAQILLNCLVSFMLFLMAVRFNLRMEDNSLIAREVYAENQRYYERMHNSRYIVEKQALTELDKKVQQLQRRAGEDIVGLAPLMLSSRPTIHSDNVYASPAPAKTIKGNEFQQRS